MERGSPMFSRAKAMAIKLAKPMYDASELAKGVDFPGTPQGIDRLVISPGNQVIFCFDCVIAVCVLTTAIITPLEVAYRTRFLSQGVESGIDVLFVVDMALQCVHGYQEGGYPVLSLKRVTLRYARSWLLIDLVAVLPWESIAGSAFSFLALIKTVRLLRLRRMLDGLKMVSGSKLLSLGGIVFLWLLLAHWCGCSFFALGWMLCGNGARVRAVRIEPTQQLER